MLFSVWNPRSIIFLRVHVKDRYYLWFCRRSAAAKIVTEKKWRKIVKEWNKHKNSHSLSHEPLCFFVTDLKTTFAKHIAKERGRKKSRKEKKRIKITTNALLKFKLEISHLEQM